MGMARTVSTVAIAKMSFALGARLGDDRLMEFPGFEEAAIGHRQFGGRWFAILLYAAR
jgi:hypothetical protein